MSAEQIPIVTGAISDLAEEKHGEVNTLASAAAEVTKLLEYRRSQSYGRSMGDEMQPRTA
jgi:hypothetical protein